MRIIAGIHKGRRIETVKGKALRPTSSRTREAIFNILQHGKWLEASPSPLQGATVLDLFCGSGALGLEALSRGASHAIFVDMNPKHLNLAKDNAAHCKELDRTSFIRADSSSPPPALRPCDIIFLDPPYESGLINKAMKQLINGGWFNDNAIIITETTKHEKIADDPHLKLLDERNYGSTKLMVLQYEMAREGV